jgi:hypothetical protein
MDNVNLLLAQIADHPDAEDLRAMCVDAMVEERGIDIDAAWNFVLTAVQVALDARELKEATDLFVRPSPLRTYLKNSIARAVFGRTWSEFQLVLVAGGAMPSCNWWTNCQPPRINNGPFTVTVGASYVLNLVRNRNQGKTRGPAAKRRGRRK